MKIVLSLENAGTRVLKDRVASFFSSRIEGVRELCADFVAAGNKDRARFVLQACALMDHAVRHFEGVFPRAPNSPAPLREPREPPWVDRPEIFDLHAVSYTHLRAHETRHDLVCRLLLEKKN